MQFARPELALQYEEALRAADLTSIDQVIRDMGSGEAPALEVGEFEVNRGTRLMILGFNRVQLVRWVPVATVHTCHQCPATEYPTQYPQCTGFSCCDSLMVTHTRSMILSQSVTLSSAWNLQILSGKLSDCAVQSGGLRPKWAAWAQPWALGA